LRRKALLIEDPHDGIAASTAAILDSCNITVLNRQSWRGTTSSSLSRAPVDLVIANAISKSAQAIELFAWLRRNPINRAVFGILPQGDADFLDLGAKCLDDFLVSPVNPEEFRLRIARLLGASTAHRSALEHKLMSELAFRNITGEAPEFVRVLERLAQFSRSGAPVLLNGETGTGKELCARAIHTLSSRRNGPFIPVECGALPEQLFENEVFGHTRGAYTGAIADQKGLVALARGGTLFFDEIDGVAPAAQAKLLRLLQESTFRPLGSEKLSQADVRIVAASNSDLGRLVEEKRFRADLFFRLNVLRVDLPPLRQRRSDIPLLARRFADDLCCANEIGHKTLSPCALRKLEGYDWPGNVREVFNTIHRAVLTADGDTILASHIELKASAGQQEAEQLDAASDFRSGRAQAIETFEADYVRRLLEKHAGNVTRAAREAGKERRAFGRLVKKYSAA
jgi:DNA-binding NtrC family response regulator